MAAVCQLFPSCSDFQVKHYTWLGLSNLSRGSLQFRLSLGPCPPSGGVTFLFWCLALNTPTRAFGLTGTPARLYYLNAFVLSLPARKTQLQGYQQNEKSICLKYD